MAPQTKSRPVKLSILGLTLGVALITFAGCATRVRTIPELPELQNVTVLLGGPITFDGKREDLPRTITEAPISENELRIRYSHNEIQQRNDSLELLALFNPLSLVGFPTGGTQSTVTGKLDILKGTEVLKAYTATCILEVTRTIFSDGESFSELRRKGLVAVRDNIEAQMFQDKEFLAKLSGGHSSNSAN